VTLVTQGQGRAVATTVTAPPPLPSRFRPLARRRVLRAEQFQWERDQRLAWRAQEIFAGVGLISAQSTIAAGHAILIPHVVQVRHGSPTSLIVRTLPGQLPEDYTLHADRIARSLGVARIRIIGIGPSLIRVDLLEVDPLNEVVHLPRQPLHGPDDLMLLGVDDTGTLYRITPQDLVHLAIQGTTGSGKSIFVYGLLGQLVRAPNLLIALSDPTGLLARPFHGTVHHEWQVSGSDPEHHADLLEQLVDTMDQRIATLPPRRDQVDISEGCPLIVAVLEEYPGLIRAAGALDGTKKAGGLVERIKLLVSRLVSEGRKAGIRLVIIAQRFEASVVGGFERDQMTIKLSFRVGNAASVEMLHPTGRTAAEEHAISPPGVALLSAPGVPLVRIKSPYLGHDDGDTAYGRYWDLITGYAARLPDSGQ
jgi:DNA segregation ATPase FtsK/SpoIIIE-like protein